MGSFLGLWAALVGTFLAYLIYSALSKTFFHPLCHFPGPKLAALTRWYAAYYELIRDGDLVEHLHDLHEMYG
jgi:hypothetical protein